MIENTVASIVYTADGAQTQWTIPFSYGHTEDVKLFVKVGTADIAPVASNLYSVDTELNTITYPLSGGPLAANDKVIVMRVTEQTQEESSVLLSFKSEDIERMADKLTMEVQELQEQLSRCIAFNPVDAAEGELDAQQYIDDLTDLKDTATTQAGIATSAATTATTQAGLASTAKTAAEAAQSKAEKWAEGTDEEVAALGGTHSAEGWAGISQTAAESENVQTVIANMSDINSVADNITDVTTVSNISSAVSNVADNDTEVLLVSDNMASVITTASNINNVNTVAGVSTKVSTVADNISDVGTVADNISDVGTVANASTAVSTVANDINAVKAVNNNKTNIDAVATNQSNINAVAANATNINAVNANKTNIDTVAGNNANISTVATNISDVTSVATSMADVAAVADDLTDINAVADDLTNIDTVATNISDVSATGQHIDNVNAVAGSLAGINLVANDLTNIDIVASGVAEWQKPADWVDIRSGALPNSVYFLAAHKKDYSAYASFGVTVWVENSGTYDVYIDGIKYATTASGTSTVINWQTLNLASGYDVTYPQELRTHIVRVTQSDPTKNLDRVMLGEADSTGVNKKSTLWVHCNMNYSMNFNQFVGNTRGRMTDSLLEAVTSRDGVLKCTNITQMIGGQTNLKTIPILDMADSNGIAIPYFAYNSYANNLTNVHIRNLHQTGNKSNVGAFSYSKFKQIIFENSEVCWDAWMFQAYCLGLEKVPEGLYHTTDEQPLVVKNGWWNLKDTVLDLSQRTGLTYVQIRGNSNNDRIDGLKGLTVSPSAPLNGNSPQIDVQYTGLNRAALIALFKSMPYNVGYNVTGTPTITDGIMSNFSNSNYAQTNLAFDVSSYDNIEIYIRVKTPATISAGWTDIIENGGVGNSRNLGVYCNNELTSKYFNLFGYDFWRYRISEDTWYRLKITATADSQNGYIYDDNGNLLIQSEDSQRRIAGNSVLTFGGSYSPNKINAIDFNNTYIKVNGVPWFTGKAAMTKTCSVVGCTGTADLTAEDKAIATDKGWSLTLS